MHSSSLKRKLSATSASIDGLPCHSNGSTAGRNPRTASALRPAAAAAAVAERVHLPNGVPSGAAPDLSPKRRRLSRQQQQADDGVPPPSPDRSGAAAAPSAASPGERQKGSKQQLKGANDCASAQEQPSEAGTADTDSTGACLCTPHHSGMPGHVTQLPVICHICSSTNKVCRLSLWQRN